MAGKIIFPFQRDYIMCNIKALFGEEIFRGIKFYRIKLSVTAPIYRVPLA
jgi:hypothetical protein